MNKPRIVGASTGLFLLALLFCALGMIGLYTWNTTIGWVFFALAAICVIAGVAALASKARSRTGGHWRTP